MANTGLAAADLAAQNDYDLIFLDCQMPEMDGFQTAKTIRASEADQPIAPAVSRTRRTPIIALTDDSMESIQEQCLAAGMDAWIAKPIRPSTIQDILSRWAA